MASFCCRFPHFSAIKGVYFSLPFMYEKKKIEPYSRLKVKERDALLLSISCLLQRNCALRHSLSNLVYIYIYIHSIHEISKKVYFPSLLVKYVGVENKRLKRESIFKRWKLMNDQSRSLPENILRIKKMKNSCSGLLVFFAMDFRPLWDT